MKRTALRKFRFPILFVTLFAAMLAVVGIDTLVAPLPLLALPIGIGLAAAGIACYRRLSQFVEARDDVAELAAGDRWPGLRKGALLGFGLFCAVLLLIGVVAGFLGLAGMMASVAVMEEVLFRGVLFRILEERAGTVIALVVPSLLFGATHLVNVNATPWGALAIGLTGGPMLAAAYTATRSLWSRSACTSPGTSPTPAFSASRCPGRTTCPTGCCTPLCRARRCSPAGRSARKPA